MSTTLITLAEAASYLGVSKATLRNWDKEGKLKAHRHPLNRYRAYDLEELRALRAQAMLPDEADAPIKKSEVCSLADVRGVKRVVSRLHNILRDTDGDSNILQRFDELTKLLFLKLYTEGGGEGLFAKQSGENAESYCTRIRGVYAQHAASNPEIIPAKFSTLKCSNQAISQCGTVLGTVTFADANFDVKGVAYEEVIRGTFDKSDHQQFFTPHQIVEFMVAMMRPFLKGRVMDPACGTAGFLAEAVRAAKSNYDELIGLEIDDRLAWVSGVNLLLHGSQNFTTRCLGDGGTLGSQADEYLGTVDIILTNPPFGSDFTVEGALENFELGKGRSSRRRGILFIERCWQLLKEDGLVAIIIDDGVLSLSSALDVRRFILDHFEILSIVSLPETAFMPYATVNASILFLRKTRSRNASHSVFFARAEKIGRKPNGDEDVLYDDSGLSKSNSDLPKILDFWRNLTCVRGVDGDDMMFVADVSENLCNDASLRLDFRYHHPSRHRSRELLDHSAQKLYALTDLCDERNEAIVPSTEMPDQVILYTGLANIEAGNGVSHQVPTPAASIKSAVKRYEPNDIVFARMRPNLRKVALMAFAEGGYVSPECTVLSVRKNTKGEPLLAPQILAAVLRSDLVFGQILHLIAGIGRPRLNTTDLRKVRIPLPPKRSQQEGMAEFEGRLASARQLRSKAQALMDESAILEVRAVEELANRLISG